MGSAAAELYRSLNVLARECLHTFVMLAFGELQDEDYLDNFHIAAIARQLERAEQGEVKRLIIAMPPRTMKSFIASICYPAWLLGRSPGAKIICASYAQGLSEDFAFQMRRLMTSDFYRAIFPGTHIDPKRSSLEIVATTRGGFRRSTSVGGALTGRGGDFIIIDDPIKAADAYSEAVLTSAMNWYTGTVSSRLDNPKKGRIILVQQRLAIEDLAGQLGAAGGWNELVLPLVEWQEREIELRPGRWITRPPGHLLHEERFSEEFITQQTAAMGARDFDAQYNQRPLPPGGALFKLEWLKRYEQIPAAHCLEGIFQSWDTAYEVSETNDYSVCTTWALSGKNYYLLDVYRARLAFPDLQKAVFEQRQKWKADLVIVESVGAGISLYQNIRRNEGPHWLTRIRPEGSKQDRASKQTPKFERGEVFVPETACWLKCFEDELMRFPHGKHDDQVDSVVQFLAGADTGQLLAKADMARNCQD